ncbi:C-C motif chemokine 27b [Cyprinus carpio]|uniref:C-C motif chemokine 27b n=3 Tax=Cyprinus carpio TaxID=7962 RepID=A0A8C2K9K3_CYPCA|nr:C-C motif chemokine 27b [Cyprinus carpio]
MELLVFGILLSVTFSAVQGVTPRCCVETIKRFPLEILMKVSKYEVQTSHGACAIDALILHARDQRYCATPKLQRFLQILLKLKMRHGLKTTASAV